MKITVVPQRLCVVAALLVALSPATANECSTLAIYTLNNPPESASYSTTSNIYFQGQAMGGMIPTRMWTSG
jgi:hypothetical protein